MLTFIGLSLMILAVAAVGYQLGRWHGYLDGWKDATVRRRLER